MSFNHEPEQVLHVPFYILIDMIITIPLSPDLVPDTETIDRLQTQFTIELCIGGKAGAKLFGVERLQNICGARNSCLESISQHDFGVMNDNDCHHLYDNNIASMQTKLESDHDLVCVALLKQGDGLDPNHIACGCMMFKKSFFDLNIKFEVADGLCECRTFTNRIKQVGKKIDYVDDVIRIKDTHQNTFA